MAKSPKFYHIRKTWDRIVSLASYANIVNFPVRYLYVHHSVTYVGGSSATHATYLGLLKKDNQESKQRARELERQSVRMLEQIALGRGFTGISYTHVVFPSGRVYFGRGFRKVGAHTLGYNETGFGVVAVGNYEVDKPTDAMVNGFVRTFHKAIRFKRAAKDSFVGGHRDADNAATACPGKNLYARVPEIRQRTKS